MASAARGLCLTCWGSGKRWRRRSGWRPWRARRRIFPTAGTPGSHGASGRAHADASAERGGSAGSAAELHVALLDGAIAHLGAQQHEMIRRAVHSQLEAAMRGGREGVEHDVAADLLLKPEPYGGGSDKVTLSSGKPVVLWPLVLGRLRCGDRGGDARPRRREVAAGRRAAAVGRSLRPRHPPQRAPQVGRGGGTGPRAAAAAAPSRRGAEQAGGGGARRVAVGRRRPRSSR